MNVSHRRLMPAWSRAEGSSMCSRLQRQSIGVALVHQFEGGSDTGQRLVGVVKLEAGGADWSRGKLIIGHPRLVHGATFSSLGKWVALYGLDNSARGARRSGVRRSGQAR
jgi:hypothetical protein